MKRDYEILYDKKWPFANISIYTIKQYLKGEMKLEKLSETDNWYIYFKHMVGFNIQETSFAAFHTFEDYLEKVLKILKERITAEELSYFLENLD